jgi:hypothetical protein
LKPAHGRANGKLRRPPAAGEFKLPSFVAGISRRSMNRR